LNKMWEKRLARGKSVKKTGISKGKVGNTFTRGTSKNGANRWWGVFGFLWTGLGWGGNGGLGKRTEKK